MRKLCQRCGKHSDTMDRQRRCKRIVKRWNRSFYCWGRLVPDVKMKRDPVEAVTIPHGAGIGYVLSDDAEEQRITNYLFLAERERDKARRKVTEKTTEIARLTKSLVAWEQKANAWARKASMTRDEVAAERKKRREAREKGRQSRTVRRGMKVT